jgi:hypothetical protein
VHSVVAVAAVAAVAAIVLLIEVRFKGRLSVRLLGRFEGRQMAIYIQLVSGKSVYLLLRDLKNNNQFLDYKI